MDTLAKALEPDALLHSQRVGNLSSLTDRQVELSKAISLKRIADTLEALAAYHLPVEF